MIVDSIADVSSQPTFLRLPNLLRESSVHLKVEGLNVAGSIKLKTARFILKNLEERGVLHRGRSVIESSSGNLGVALAMLCAERGYPFICVSDPNISPATRRLISALHGRVIIVRDRDAQGGYLKARLDLIRRMVDENPQLVWTDQYSNRANSLAHYMTTGPEILQAFSHPDWVFIGAGTTGTLGGVARYMREHSPGTQVIAIDSVGSVTFGTPSGVRHLPGMGTSFAPAIAQDCRAHMSRLVLIPESDAVMMCRQLTRRHGLIVGPSTGSVLAGVVSLSDEIASDATVVAISPDLGDRYIETLYDDEWVQERFPQLCSLPAPALTAD